MSKDHRVYLAHIMECIQKIERYTKDGRERFLDDQLIQDAVLRNFEVIGEAARTNLPVSNKSIMPSVLYGLLAQQPIVGQGKSVCLIPDLLQVKRCLFLLSYVQRAVQPRHIDLLLSFC